MARRTKDRTGEKYHHFTIKERLPNRICIRSSGGQAPRAVWLLICDYCGQGKEVEAAYINGGHVPKCSCRKHTKHPLFPIWKSMHRRCNDPNLPGYEYWGGKGITVCPEWDDFWQFVEDMGERPDGYSLERKDGDKGYCKENCKWATDSEQNINRSGRNNVTLNGETKPLSVWSKETGISQPTLKARITRGWSDEAVLFKGQKGEHAMRTAKVELASKVKIEPSQLEKVFLLLSKIAEKLGIPLEA